MLNANPWYADMLDTWQVRSKIMLSENEWKALDKRKRVFLAGLIEAKEREDYKLYWQTLGKFMNKMFGKS